MTEQALARDFGFGGAVRRLTVPHVRVLPGPYAFRHALGAVAVATVGVAILSSLSKSEAREITRRTTKALRASHDEELVDIYTIKKGKKQVTIKTTPAQPRSSFTDDPALKPDPAKPEENEDPNNKGKPGDDPKNPERDEDSVVFDDLPLETKCKKQTVEVADAGATKTDAAPAPQNNAVIMCEMSDGDWKPAKLKQVAAAP
jgi:hypothetical protein